MNCGSTAHPQNRQLISFFSVFSESIISQIIGDELLKELQPHRRVKRREKILPGQFVTDLIRRPLLRVIVVFQFLSLCPIDSSTFPNC